MLIKDKLAMDTKRSIDSNGYMHVSVSNLTKEQVVPYLGDTIPDWKNLGLEADKIYQIYRPADEIEKAVDTFNGLPLMLDHWDMDAENIPKENVVGSLGTDAKWNAPYLTNSIIITDAKAIRKVEDGSYAELSSAYSCDIDMTGGVFGGKSYDGVMKNIRGNHVALVSEGRAGHDVRVADSALEGGEKKVSWLEKFREAIVDVMTDKEAMMDIMNGNESMPKDADMNQPVGTENEQVTAPTQDEEPVDALADDVRQMMTEAGLNPDDKNMQKAFLAGMAVKGNAEDGCGEEANDEDVPENAQDADGEAEAQDEGDNTNVPAETAQDKAIVQDRAFFSALYEASEAVAPFVGKIQNPFAFDSADAIYKKALVAQGVCLDGVDPRAYKAMVSMLNRPQNVPMAEAEVDPINARLMGIKSR
jgi:hypothetical protein